ncbi:MAG TPA: DNA alkylation repair protein [Thermoanaerobaculia bacterium]|nr:DNA alkylation repair protein [Thermoanaerobaculia bacterium]
MLTKLRRRLRTLANPERAAHSLRFFKTAPGQYGHGDRFLGLTVPAMRLVVREFCGLPLHDAGALLASPWHEDRLVALMILVERYRRTPAARAAIFRLYLGHTDRINNWDLVDVSAANVAGAHLEERSRKPLYRLAKSKSLWERRIAIVATLHFIRRNQFEDTLAISKVLLGDKHDLIHKACGWMLREVGKRDENALRGFLEEHAATMPRTMLRYAIERLPDRLRYLTLK